MKAHSHLKVFSPQQIDRFVELLRIAQNTSSRTFSCSFSSIFLWTTDSRPKNLGFTSFIQMPKTGQEEFQRFCNSRCQKNACKCEHTKKLFAFCKFCMSFIRHNWCVTILGTDHRDSTGPYEVGALRQRCPVRRSPTLALLFPKLVLNLFAFFRSQLSIQCQCLM